MHDNRIPLLQGAIIENGKTTYKVKEYLGGGGTSLVYLCEYNHIVVAVKELYPKELEFSLHRDATGKLEFADGMNTQYSQDVFCWHKRNMRSEASLHSVATHSRNMSNNDPFFVACEGVFDYNGTAYCVYQTANGTTLKDYVATIRDSDTSDTYLAEVLSIIAITAKKIDCIHQAGLLHLDISPSNLYMIDHGNGIVPYLLDFGSACRVNDVSSIDNHRFSVTNGFSAPELYCRSEGNHLGYPVTMATDTYGLVAVLFWALYGQTYRDCLLSMEAWENEIRDRYSHADLIVHILKKGLGEQRNRYQSATELCSDLVSVLTLLEGDMNRTKEILSQMNMQFHSYTQDIKDTIKNSVSFINDHINEGVSDVKEEIHKSKIHLLLGGGVLVILAVGILAWLLLSDFSPPAISLIGVKRDSDGFVCVEKNELTFCFQYTDNKGLDWEEVSETDIVLDGFTAEQAFEPYYNGFYKLTLTNIKQFDPECAIVIKGGCAKDKSGKLSNEEHFFLKVYHRPGDATIPTVNISRPFGKDGNDIIVKGEQISYMVYFDDDTALSTVNVTPQYIRACGFHYDEMISTEKGAGCYEITFTNVQGNKGKHYIYVAPGAVIDRANNYSKGVESFCFYLCDSIDEVDTTPPQIDVSCGMISGNLAEYQVTASDDMELHSFWLKPEFITPVGFEADVKVDIDSDHNARVIRFTNIHISSADPYFILDSGIAEDAFGNKSSALVVSLNID